MYYNDNTSTLDVLSKLFGDMQYIHNADETTLCMLRSLQAAYRAVRLHSLDAPWTFCTVFCCRERLSKSILKAFHQMDSHLVIVSSPEERVWWRRLDCKATVFSNGLHVDQTSLYTRSNDAPLCFRVATTCGVLLFVVMTGTNCPSRSLPSYNHGATSDIFLQVSLAPVL